MNHFQPPDLAKGFEKSVAVKFTPARAQKRVTPTFWLAQLFLISWRTPRSRTPEAERGRRSFLTTPLNGNGGTCPPVDFFVWFLVVYFCVFENARHPSLALDAIS